jgi:hypothetical protein
MSNSQYIIKKAKPKIVFWYDSQTDIRTFSKYSEILKQLNTQVKITVSFKENLPISFSFKGGENNSYSYPYHVSSHIHQDNKDELDRKYCYEVGQKDILILNKFFEKTPRSIESVRFYNIWFHEFLSCICTQNKLKKLTFHSCRIDNFPDKFKNMTNLEDILMRYSWVRMPNSFANCKNLRKIDFSEACLIDKFPDDIGNCQKLQKLIYAEAYLDIPAHVRKKIGITTLPPSIGKIPNLTKIKLTGCVNLRSLPEELAFFPLKSIILDNCMIRDEQKFLKAVGKNVLINWYNLGASYFDNVGEINFDFDLIIDRLSPIFECLEPNVFEMLIWNFPNKKNLIIRILEQWAEKSSNLEIKEKFQNFISNFSPKIEIPKGRLLL